MAELSEQFEEALLALDRLKARQMVEEAATRLTALELVELMVVPALTRIGSRWEAGETDLSQVYMSGRICEKLAEELKPQQQKNMLNGSAIAIATLIDQHALGKRIITSVLRAAGYPPIDLGHGLSADEIISKTIEHRINILLISTLMYSTAIEVKYLTERLRELSPDTIIIVGGAPFRLDTTLWQEVGADYDGRNGMDISSLIKRLIEGGCAA